ncbi:MAG: glycosyltransferase [Sulfuritalea sp.]|nr:glycosyltransferase [Sulfuritalea sp.]
MVAAKAEIPKISVIIPTRNRLELLRNAVASVFGQTEQDFELIVVDDGSKDGTHAYLEALAADDSRVRPIFNQQSRGGAAARNTGISVSRGRWIAFLDDDDEWLRHKLALQLSALAAAPNAVACSSSYLRRNAAGRTRVVHIPRTASFEDLLYGSVMGGTSLCLCNGAAVRGIGGFDPMFRSGQDWDLWTRLSQIGTLISCAEPTVIYRAHDGVRISNDMAAQYQGARRFYFKYKQFMGNGVRAHRLAYLWYIMSRQPERGIWHRLKYLTLAISKAGTGAAVRYTTSSLPRLLADIVSCQRHKANRHRR